MHTKSNTCVGMHTNSRDYIGKIMNRYIVNRGKINTITSNYPFHIAIRDVLVTYRLSDAYFYIKIAEIIPRVSNYVSYL